MTVLDLYEYLNKLDLADQVHIRGIDQIVFYHWNRAKSDLIPSLTLEGKRIEKMFYPRSVMPKIYALANQEFEFNFTDKHEFVRDLRGRQ